MNCIYVRRRYLAAVGKGRINVGVYEVFRKTSWRINCILPAKRLVYLVNVEKKTISYSVYIHRGYKKNIYNVQEEDKYEKVSKLVCRIYAGAVR